MLSFCTILYVSTLPESVLLGKKIVSVTDKEPPLQ